MREKINEIWEKNYVAIIVGCVVVAVSISGILLYGILFGNHEKDKLKHETIEKLDEAGISEKEQETMPESIKEHYLYDGNITEMNKEHITSDFANATEYKNTDETLLRLYELYGAHDYDGVVEIVVDILAKHNLTEGKNTEIAALYKDAAKMRHFNNFEPDVKERTLLTRKHPVSLAIDCLYANPARRNVVLIDKASLSPMFLQDNSDVEITSIAVIDKEADEYKRALKLVGDEYRINNLYKIHMKIPYSEVDCIILETPILEYRIIGYYGDDADRYITQAEWNSDYPDIEKD